ncbi:hypothetical protein COY87_01570 [Candidatus Roizmanbacteria bacterium CG_4_10_14_0_8_um_filter_33_9]|uniref:Glycosyltransferase RgtA/B/C/D-like domain-containing protein n=1 Tax=Candidatus Roizmanbacteria bacterium CG_4_10_14_0_8_um_filter_33_9 TaxID=1974826 RepID=A0A2M7QJX8_9BACT|nr:MAG: hypothetical protein COY87_01570 [Candidatus Roizmanbacteria bacterium CG_4_10_14_0_8_um_filter_33_9]
MFDIQSIFQWIKNHFSKKDIIFIAILAFFYFLIRLINLEQLPIFNDEGIYIHWAKVAWHDASWRFVSLTDGKQPLQTWGTIPFLKLFPDNALLAGRLFSVATGFFGLTGFFSLLFYIFNKKTALIGSLIYIITPYFLFYDRMAMVDSGVNAFFIWILFFSILLVKTIRLDVALLFGLVAGMGLLAKSSVRLFVGLSLLAPILINDSFIKFKKQKIKLLSFFTLFAIVGFLAIAIYNIQRLSPFLHFVEEKNKTFVMTFGEWRQNPFAVLFHNLRTIPYYVFSELGWIIVPFGILGLRKLFIKDKKLFFYLIAWILTPYIGISLLTRVLFPRYIIFFGTLIVVFASYYLGTIKKQMLLIGSLLIILLGTLFFNYSILFDYSQIPFPPTDRGQYVESVTVGYGIKDIITYAREKSKEKPVIILAEGDFGMTGDILDVFLRKEDQIFIKGYWPLGDKELLQHQVDLQKNYVYIVTSHSLEYPKHWPVKFIKSYYKPNRSSVIYLLELTQ